MIPPLTKKAYRTFSLAVVRDDGTLSRNISASEWVWLSLRIAWPQATCLVAIYLLKVSLGLFLLIDFGLVGPLALNFAQKQTRPNFRLQAFGIRYI